MKSTKLLTTLLVLFVSSTLFAQKVHYKDSYYTIVKSKIFHRGHDVFGRLTAGKIDTIYMIAKELYDERGKLKEQYKNRKKRDRYKLPDDFWEQKNIAVAEAGNTNENKVTESTVVLSEGENQKVETVVTETNASAANTAPKNTEKKVIEKTQEEREEVAEPKKATSIVAKGKKEKEDTDVEHKKEKENLAKREIAQEKQVKAQKEEAAKREKAMIIKENIASKKEEKLARSEEKKAQLKEKNKQQKKEKKEEITKRKNEQEKRTKTQKEEAAGRKNDKEKRENKIANENEKTDKKHSQEAKKLEKKKKDLEKEKKTQSKKQNSLVAKEAALISATAVSRSISNNDTFGTIYIKVNKEKTSATKSGAVLLFFDVINNSNKDLVILKPNNSLDSRLDFFSNIIECADIPIIATDYVAKELKIKDEDYLTIPANAKIELFVNGTYRNWLACNSEDIILQIQYNPFKSAEEGNELQPAFKKEISNSLKRVTPIKIESENIKFKLNKQE